MVRRALILKPVTLSVTAASSIAEAQERPRGLTDLVSRLSVSGRGVTTWLERLGVNSANLAVGETARSRKQARNRL